MDKWKYKYSFLSGILFLFSFFTKELVINSNNLTSLISYAPYLLMIVYFIGLFIGLLKYSKLNNKYPLFYTSFAVMVLYPVRVIIEFFLLTAVIDTDSSIVSTSGYSLGLVLILFGISIFLRKKIYGKLTLLQGASSILFGFSLLVPVTDIVLIFQLPIFLSFIISLTYIVNKNKNKLVKKEPTPRFLSNRY